MDRDLKRKKKQQAGNKGIPCRPEDNVREQKMSQQVIAVKRAIMQSSVL